MKVVIPAARPVAGSITANGSIEPFDRRSRRRSISSRIFSGGAIDVYHSFHSSPSRTDSTRPSRWACDSGSSAAWGPRRVTGVSQGIAPSYDRSRVCEIQHAERAVGFAVAADREEDGLGTGGR